MSTPTADDLFEYVQERCLWQFFSRSWDRVENIEGIFGTVADLLTGHPLAFVSPMDRLFYADAKILVTELSNRYPGLKSMDHAHVRELVATVKARVTELAVTQSRNRELHQKLY